MISSPNLNKLLIAAGIVATLALGGFFFWFSGDAPVEVLGKLKGSPTPSNLSRLTGKPCDFSQVRPTIVMLAGDPVARPLSGIAQADVVVEMPVTPNGVTRFMALFQCHHPKEIGSIRSARDDFLPLAASFDPIYAHWGGEHGALDKLNAGILDNVDALKYEGSVFYRKAGIKMPHNGFSTIEKIMDKASALKYSTSWDMPGYSHTDIKTPTNIASLVQTITIPYPDPFDVTWNYDQTTQTYKRLRDGTPERDADSQETVSAGVVIIMRTTSSPLRDQYLIVNTQGSGEALIYQRGTMTTATWRKDESSLASKLIFVDDRGKEIPFASGNIWIHVTTPL